MDDNTWMHPCSPTSKNIHSSVWYWIPSWWPIGTEGKKELRKSELSARFDVDNDDDDDVDDVEEE